MFDIPIIDAQPHRTIAFKSRPKSDLNIEKRRMRKNEKREEWRKKKEKKRVMRFEMVFNYYVKCSITRHIIHHRYLSQGKNILHVCHHANTISFPSAPSPNHSCTSSACHPYTLLFFITTSPPP
jgi:hypothetical protein